MSLWTPDGERPVPPKQSTAQPSSSPTAAQAAPQSASVRGQGGAAIEVTPELAEALATAGIDVATLSPEQIAEATQMLAEMGRVRQEMLAVPASEIVANHLMGIYELGAIHLGENPPNFAEATIAIEALRAVLDRLSGKFADAEPVLRQALTQLQQVFVELKEQVEARPGSPADESDDPDA